MNVIDLFSGCGGLSEGFRMAGLTIVGGIDINSDAVDSYNHNFNDSKGVCLDLLNLQDEEIPNIFGVDTKIDVIIGGPPCQGFSSANRYGQNDDSRNKLFFEYVKFVDYYQPKFVVIENVRGIITQNKGYAKDEIYRIFEERGYIVNHKILNAADYGVPQNRLRNFFVMTKKSAFDFDSMKKIENHITVLDAIEELYDIEKNHKGDNAIYALSDSSSTDYKKYLRAENHEIHNHDVRYPADIQQERISHVPMGGNWRDIPEELFPNNRKNRHSSAYKRLDEKSVSCTIDTGNAHSNYFHPLYNRIPTVREAARIQSFKDEFIFKGSRTSQYRQVGNAVPPLLAMRIAEVIKELYLNES